MSYRGPRDRDPRDDRDFDGPPPRRPRGGGGGGGYEEREFYERREERRVSSPGPPPMRREGRGGGPPPRVREYEETDVSIRERDSRTPAFMRRGGPPPEAGALVLRERYDDGWSIDIAAARHVEVDGYANAWILPDDLDGEVTMHYDRALPKTIAIALSLVSMLAGAALAARRLRVRY